jgi:phosphate transport system substrate-binding protein
MLPVSLLARRTLGLVSAALWLAACVAPTSTPAPTPISVRVAATDLAAPLLRDLVSAYAAEQPDVLIEPEIVAASALPGALETGASTLGLTAQSASGPFATPLGYATFVAAAHPAVPVNALTVAELRQMRAGRITNWSQVGGSAGAVQVVVREAGADGTLSVLEGEPVTPNALIAPTWEAMRTLIAETPGAVGLLPTTELDDTVRLVSLDASLRVLIVAVAPVEPEGAAREFLAWAQSEAGQAVVARRHQPVR